MTVDIVGYVGAAEASASAVVSGLIDLVERAHSLPREALAGDVDRVFRQSPSLRCMVVESLEGPRLVERSWFQQVMSGPLGYGRVLYSGTPVLELDLPVTLTVGPQTSIGNTAAAIIRASSDGAFHGEYVLVAVQDRPTGVVPITAVFEQVARLFAHQSLHDPLTGLPNRLALTQSIRRIVGDSQDGTAACTALLYVDLDRFKDVNDVLGHAAGDEVLVQFAARLRSACRRGDLVVRIGGDEFAILTQGPLDSNSAPALADRVVSQASVPFSLTRVGINEVVSLGASVGLARADATLWLHEDPTEVLLKRADIAMYQAKARGRGRVSTFAAGATDSDAAISQVRDRRRMERRLRRAVDQDQIELHFQPLVQLPSGRVVGVEALARWSDEELGIIGPDQFIPLAEQTGLIIDLGRALLIKACREAASWPAPPDGQLASVAVNISPVQLREPGFFEEVVAVLAETGLSSRRLCLEITETAAVTDLEQTAQLLHDLRLLGVTIALDDFGTGYSSLTMLQRLPVDLVKLDRSFVARMMTDPGDMVLVRLIIEAAHGFGLRVCAEGVEDLEQARALASIGCDSCQGWHFGRPAAPSNALVEQLTSGTGHQDMEGQLHAHEAPGDSGELVIVTGPDGCITYASPSARELLGWAPQEMLNTPSRSYLDPNDPPLNRPAPSSSTKSTTSRPVTHRVVHRDGSRRWFTTTVRRLGQSDAVAQTVSVSRDITTQVVAERALVDQQALFQQVFDISDGPMALTGMDGRFIRVNSAFADLLGRQPTKLLGLRVQDITHPDDRPADEQNLAELCQDVTQKRVVRKRYLTTSGATISVVVRAVLVRTGAESAVLAHVRLDTDL